MQLNHLTAVRVALGLYVAGHLAALLPWAPEVFSSAGMLPDASLSPLAYAFPNLLTVFDSPAVVLSLVGAGVVSALALVAGRAPRIAAVGCWYVLTCLLGRNPLILNPALPMVGWCLLWLAAWPTEALHGRGSLPRELVHAAWAIAGLSYGYSAYTKLGSPSWDDGTALYHLWANPLARDTALRPWLLAQPELPVKALTWGTLALELAVLPAIVVPRLRRPVWWGLLAMHVGLLITVDFADLTMGMLATHLALWTPGSDRLEALPRRPGVTGRPLAAQPLKIRYHGGLAQRVSPP